MPGAGRQSQPAAPPVPVLRASSGWVPPSIPAAQPVAAVAEVKQLCSGQGSGEQAAAAEPGADVDPTPGSLPATGASTVPGNGGDGAAAADQAGRGRDGAGSSSGGSGAAGVGLGLDYGGSSSDEEQAAGCGATGTAAGERGAASGSDSDSGSDSGSGSGGGGAGGKRFTSFF